MIIQIKHRFTDAVLCEFEADNIKDCLEKAVKSDANLSGANLYGANLIDANLSGANLSGANLIDANLIDANLIDANLSDANLSGANLSGANLIDANLSGANLDGEKIAIAPISVSGIIWTITITESYLRIGCQRHTHSEWEKFTDDEIKKMESRASAFWKQNKSWILSACKAHRKESLEFRKANHVKEIRE